MALLFFFAGAEKKQNQDNAKSSAHQQIGENLQTVFAQNFYFTLSHTHVQRARAKALSNDIAENLFSPKAKSRFLCTCELAFRSTATTITAVH